MTALVDTGAEITAMDNSLAAQLPQLWLRPSDRRITGADDTDLEVQGRADLTIEAEGITTMVSVYIIEGLSPPFIMGMDCMEKLGVIIDIGNRSVTFTNRPTVARSKSQTVIPPRSVKVCALKIPSQDEGTIVLESLHLGVSDCITRLRDEKCQVPVFNPTNEAIVIKRRQPIGVVRPFERVVEKDTAMLNVSDLRNPSFRSKIRKKIKCLESSGCREECSSCKSYIALISQLEPIVIAQTGSQRLKLLNMRRKELQAQLDKLDLSNIPAPHRDAYVHTLFSYEDVLSVDSNEVGKCEALPQRIILQDEKKIACTPPYRVPEHLRTVAEEYVEKLRDAGIIQKSTSPFNSPLLLVRKAGATPDKPLVEQYRVVHDYRKLNENTVKDSYPMRM